MLRPLDGPHPPAVTLIGFDFPNPSNLPRCGIRSYRRHHGERGPKARIRAPRRILAGARVPLSAVKRCVYRARARRPPGFEEGFPRCVPCDRARAGPDPPAPGPRRCGRVPRERNPACGDHSDRAGARADRRALERAALDRGALGGESRGPRADPQPTSGSVGSTRRSNSAWVNTPVRRRRSRRSRVARCSSGATASSRIERRSLRTTSRPRSTASR